jgi:hypothetical protein
MAKVLQIYLWGSILLYLESFLTVRLLPGCEVEILGGTKIEN